MYFYGPPHIAGHKQDDQLEHTYNSYVRIRDVPEDLPEAMNDREKWREMLVARHDDDTDNIIIAEIITLISLTLRNHISNKLTENLIMQFLLSIFKLIDKTIGLDVTIIG